MKSDHHDNRPQPPDGIDPQAAADEFGEILESSGKGQGILAQLNALKSWAEKSGCRIGRNFDLSQARLGGLEHFVWHDESKQVVRKFTYGGMFGRTVRRISEGLVPASPLEYLRRWANHNILFPPITRVSGVLDLPSTSLALLIEQDALLGELPSTKDIVQFMDESGFTSISDENPFSWVNRKAGFAAFDARPANFVSVAGVPIPFDLVIVPLKNLRG